MNNIAKNFKKVPTSTHKKRAGFTLVETLMAISILITAVIGATTAAQSGLALSIFSKEQIIAFYLAQEGVEQIRNIRDENGLNDRNWLAGIAESPSDPCYFTRVCTAEPLSPTGDFLAFCPGGECDPLSMDEDGFYGYSGDPTSFTREISLSQISADEVSVLVTISWSKGTISRQFRARENILNWQ